MNGPGYREQIMAELSLRSDEEIVRLRQAVRNHAIAHGFSLVEQTKFVTAASELARNTLQYGGGGDARLDALTNGVRRGLRLTFIDRGPGIANLDDALRDGYTSGAGLGLGLGGARRLCDEFAIQSAPGAGTTVTITKWKAY
ncbi:anti-sigma regulatory factor [Paraburkholderia caballeronis]|uniref:Serine/threonine-protein kinase RsbT n=1 Tax=Paraburkholderia caballeronis TaxID=416943 RepID=A0A1H7STM7_9BURK|nr:anti-sigma regulatory factor [Paraburkholderia caballeronis]PXW25643.1 serine/threonine-protein kinase RsbT [Paraburkholderia caballeronis]PXX01250.1 serine/threonine-protein kinase RsbT [Paraburkholderia caballeronis]RAJ99397.1 serine/threonine-protein kinase RsbT [Paraburkholderia caballeronis]TDV07116.1 serine/threonine-protein kinase RsbT [Paraburkholderia caballeronis]TDV11260.1 serine/threonine-protein kinase RsbT [Paraburkholderia caballeronis]